MRPGDGEEEDKPTPPPPGPALVGAACREDVEGVGDAGAGESGPPKQPEWAGEDATAAAAASV